MSLIDSSELVVDFLICNEQDPHWTPERVHQLIYRQKEVSPIEARIDLESIDPKPGQYIIWTVDTDIFDIDSVNETFKRLVPAFPDNKIVAVLNNPLKIMDKENVIKMLKVQIKELEDFE